MNWIARFAVILGRLYQAVVHGFDRLTSPLAWAVVDGVKESGIPNVMTRLGPNHWVWGPEDPALRRFDNCLHFTDDQHEAYCNEQ